MIIHDWRTIATYLSIDEQVSYMTDYIRLYNWCPYQRFLGGYATAMCTSGIIFFVNTTAATLLLWGSILTWIYHMYVWKKDLVQTRERWNLVIKKKRLVPKQAPQK